MQDRTCGLLVLLLLLAGSAAGGRVVKILGLFSGVNNELGIDHRLGRQVLRLAAERARQLHPEQLERVELSVLSDQTECSSLNSLPGQVARRFYLGEAACSTATCSDDSRLLERYLNRSSSSSRGRRAQAERQVDAIIGPSCDYLVDLVARMAAYWGTPIYSVASVGDSFARKDVYPTLTRLSPSIEQLAAFVGRTLEAFRWRHLVVLADQRQAESALLLSGLERTFQRLRFELAIEQQVFRFGAELANELAANRSQVCSSPLALKLLQDFGRLARVLVVVTTEQQLVRRLLLCAHQLHMNNGEFTFLALDLGLRAARAREAGAEREGGGAGGQQLDWFVAGEEQSNPLARQMFESLMVFSVELPIGAQYSLFVEQALDAAHQEEPGVRFERASVGALAVALHDSLLLAVEAQLREGPANGSAPELDEGAAAAGGRASPPLMWGQQYSAGLFERLEINANGDQELDYVLSDFEPELGVMRPVASYSKEARRLRLLPGAYVHWPRRGPAGRAGAEAEEPPPDEPECGFTGEAERCLDRQNLHAALTLSGLLGSLALGAGLLGLHKFRRIRYQMQLDDLWWKISWQELQFIAAGESLCSTAMSVAHQIRAGSYSVVSSASGSHVQLESGGPRRPALIVTSSCEGAGRRRLSAARSESHASGGLEAGSLAAAGQLRSEYSSVVRQSRLALLRDQLVIVKQLNGSQVEVSRELLVELRSMREHQADNLARFMGLCLEPARLAVVYEYCSRGSLQDLLLNEKLQMDWTLKCSILGDIVAGLAFIHTTLLDFHGRLKSTNLVLDSRFTVKITDFGLQSLYAQLQPLEAASSDSEEPEEPERAQRRRQPDQLSLSVSQAAYNMESVSQRGQTGPARARSQAPPAGPAYLRNRRAARHFWTAPELLRQDEPAGSKRADVYALAVIMSELFTRKPPYFFGTNAKPHWPAVKRERRLHPQPPASSQTTSLAGSLGRRAQRQLRRVAPAAESVEETGSLGSLQSLQSGGAPEPQVAGSLVSSRSSQAPRRPSVRLPGAIAEEGGAEAPASAAQPSAADQQLVDAEEVLDQLRMGVEPEPVRPYLPSHLLQEVDGRLVELMRACWAEAPGKRPSVVSVRNQLRRITRGMASRNYLDNLLERLQSYAAELERLVDGRSAAILEEKQRTEELLYQLVPRFVADRLKRQEAIVPQLFDGVTVFFSDIVGFEQYASVMSPCQLVDLLNSIYASFDSVISSFDVTKIETIIDQFLVAAGISLRPDGRALVEAAPPPPEGAERRPSTRGRRGGLLGSLRRAHTALTAAEEPEADEGGAPNDEAEHYRRSAAEQVARMALCVRDLVKSFHFRQTLGGAERAGALVAATFNIRIGIHSGKVCAGIVGLKRPKFCLIGDTVNVASRMHTNSKANKIQISQDTRRLLDRVPGLSIEPRGSIEVKGKGLMETYWLESAY